MSGTYTSDEKVEFALKTALFRTMQSKDQPTSLEDPAPPRIFPNNIMKVNLIQKGEGDIDEDGYYVGRTNSSSAYLNDNNLVDLEKAELVISNYRIIDPSNNVITSKRVSDLTTVNESQTSITAINALPTTGTDYPKKNWFFRGHYGSASGTTAFNNASSSYDGLQLAWDKSTVGATPTEADIVPHLKFYLQVQTKYTNVAHGDNISYAHDLMKGLIGLDQGFTTTLKVNRGEGGSCTTLGATGKADGNFWFTQATSGTLSFYGVGENENELVNASDSLSNLNSTKFPMISYIRYTGETGFGAGTGGGGGSVTLASADSNVSTMIGGTAQTMTTTSFNFDGNVGIGTTSPGSTLEIKDVTSGTAGEVESILKVNSVSGYHMVSLGTAGPSNYHSGSISIYKTMGATGTTKSVHLSGSTDDTYFNGGGNVGIGTTSPGYKLEIKQGKVYLNNSNTWTDTAAANTKIYLGDTNFGVGSGHFTGDGAGEFTTLWSYNGAGRGIRFCSTALGTNKFSDYTTHMIIEGDTGNVGIGTTSPGSQCKLQVYETGTEQAWKGRGVFGNETCAFVCGVYHNKIQIGGHNGALNAWYDIAINPGGGNVGIGTTDPAYQFEVTSSGTSALFNASTAYVMGWNRSDITNGMWWWHVEGSYSTLHRNGYGHCARFYRTTNSSCCVFGDPGIANAYTEYHTNYSSWDGKLLVGAGPMGNDSGQNNWVANYACVFATTTNLHLESGAGATMYLNYYTDGNVWIDGSVRYTSDDRLKHNEKEVVNALDVINKLDVLTYFKSKKKYAENHHYELDQSGNPITDDSYYIETGLIAQRVKEIPELEYCVSYTDPIYEDDDYGDYAVNYRDIFCYNVAATQELDRKVTALETENAELKTEVATLKSELAAIKQHLGI